MGVVPVDAYQAWCDAFAFEVNFSVDGQEFRAVATTEVQREEPLPEDLQYPFR